MERGGDGQILRQLLVNLLSSGGPTGRPSQMGGGSGGGLGTGIGGSGGTAAPAPDASGFDPEADTPERQTFIRMMVETRGVTPEKALEFWRVSRGNTVDPLDTPMDWKYKDWKRRMFGDKTVPGYGYNVITTTPEYGETIPPPPPK